VKDGFTWNLSLDLSGAADFVATVPARTGPKTYTFDVSSSEALTIDAKGNLIGDRNVKLSRALMIPKSGRPIPCTAWTYNARTGASFTCDDSTLKPYQFPYRIDPSSHTYTDTGTYTVTSYYHGWNNEADSCDCSDNDVTTQFNTNGLIPSGGSLISTSCAYDVVNQADSNYPASCSVGTYNNSGNTPVTATQSHPIRARTLGDSFYAPTLVTQKCRRLNLWVIKRFIGRLPKAALPAAFVEGLNNKAKVTMRKSYGFRTSGGPGRHSLGQVPSVFARIHAAPSFGGSRTEASDSEAEARTSDGHLRHARVGRIRTPKVPVARRGTVRHTRSLVKRSCYNSLVREILFGIPTGSVPGPDNRRHSCVAVQRQASILD
jgi:hypothetical protein